MAWTIAPNRGLGPLSLGMTPEEVEALPVMGKPGHVYRGSGGRRMEYRGLDLPICEYSGDALCKIVAGRHVRGVRFEGADVFSTGPRAMLRTFEEHLGPVSLCRETLCFLKAGVILDGFYDARDHSFFEPEADYHDERSVTLCLPEASGCAETTDETVSFL